MSGHEQRPGDWRVICQRSGFKCWASETVLERRSGLRVHRRFADQEHPQDYRSGIADDTSVPFTSPEATDTFLSPGDVTPSSL